MEGLQELCKDMKIYRNLQGHENLQELCKDMKGLQQFCKDVKDLQELYKDMKGLQEFCKDMKGLQEHGKELKSKWCHKWFAGTIKIWINIKFAIIFKKIRCQRHLAQVDSFARTWIVCNGIKVC